ncbi:MAG: outer membrane lipoprotein-sorting protein [Proteobacteria bacterium]|nr:MAG: outer membrane lipoprotein-sorting protein [Pseudomonadota bacterium]
MKSAVLCLAAIFAFTPVVYAADSEATQLVEKSETQTRGKSLQAKVSMSVDNGGTHRAMSFRIWSEGKEKALIKVLTPAKDRGTGNLRLDLNLWQYLPNIERVVKIPPSMMLQSWMGSDFTNDDLVKTSSLARDYTHAIEKREDMAGTPSVKIICTPKPDAPVTWGKVILWVRASDAVPLKQEFYLENGELVKVMEGSDIKTFGSHTIPTKLTMRNVKKEGSSTTLEYQKVTFDEKISAKIFSQDNLQRPVSEE